METNNKRSFDPTKPVQTRDGRKVRIICSDRQGADPILALVEEDDEEVLISCSESGSYWSSSQTSKYDLINIPVKHVRWINIYPDGGSHSHSTKEIADRIGGISRIACVRVELEEGQYDVEV